MNKENTNAPIIIVNSFERIEEYLELIDKCKEEIANKLGISTNRVIIYISSEQD
jgi:hypothetical protein